MPKTLNEIENKTNCFGNISLDLIGIKNQTSGVEIELKLLLI